MLGKFSFAIRWQIIKGKKVKKVKLHYEPKWPTRPELSPVSVGVLLLSPGWDASPSQGYPQQYVASSHLIKIHLGEEKQCGAKLLVSWNNTAMKRPTWPWTNDRPIESPTRWLMIAGNLGRFGRHSAKIFGLEISETCHIKQKGIFPVFRNLQYGSLVDQKTYFKVQWWRKNTTKWKWKILCKWNGNSVPTNWNGKSGESPKIVHLVRKISVWSAHVTDWTENFGQMESTPGLWNSQPSLNGTIYYISIFKNIYQANLFRKVANLNLTTSHAVKWRQNTLFWPGDGSELRRREKKGERTQRRGKKKTPTFLCVVRYLWLGRIDQKKTICTVDS